MYTINCPYCIEVGFYIQSLYFVKHYMLSILLCKHWIQWSYNWDYTLRTLKHQWKVPMHPIAAQFTIAKCWKLPKCPSVNERIKKTEVHLHNGILCNRKKEGAPTLCCSMDGTGEHYAKWNKPGGKRQIPYDLSYNWNLINKTSKIEPEEWK